MKHILVVVLDREAALPRRSSKKRALEQSTYDDDASKTVSLQLLFSVKEQSVLSHLMCVPPDQLT